MRVGNLKIGVRLGLSFGAIILLAALVTVLGIQEINKLSGLTNKLTGIHMLLPPLLSTLIPMLLKCTGP